MKIGIVAVTFHFEGVKELLPGVSIFLAQFHTFAVKDSQVISLRKYELLLTGVRGDRGSAVIKVLRYKSEGRCFDSIWCHWNFSLT